MSEDSTTQILAIYGAIVSTVGGAWQFYQWWKRGPKLTGKSRHGFVNVDEIDQPDAQKFALIDVSNVGTEATTITNVGLHFYDNYFQYLRKRPSKQAIIMHAVHGYSLPHRLEVGGTFHSRCIQNDDFEEKTRSMRTYFAIYHSFHDDPLRVKVPSIGRSSK